LIRHREVDEVELHLIKYGFMRCYTQWIWHGEQAEIPAEVIGTRRRVENAWDENIENVRQENVENFMIDVCT
jgi:Transposase-associated domain